MFVAHVDRRRRRCCAGSNELGDPLPRAGPDAAPTAQRPRARWRTRLVADGNLRWFRTMLLGRAPGFAPGRPPSGRGGRSACERRRRVAVSTTLVRATAADGDDGVARCRARRPACSVRAAPMAASRSSSTGRPGATRRLELVAREGGRPRRSRASCGSRRSPAGGRTRTGRRPCTTCVCWSTSGQRVDCDRRRPRRVPDAGRRSRSDHDLERRRARPARQRRAHLRSRRRLDAGRSGRPRRAPDELRAALETVRDAGMNMLRIPGTGVYEDAAFHDLCDELGILVWQDFMFANLDYPFADDEFRALGRARGDAQLLDRLAGRPSLAVLCGNSEVEQQVAMLGLAPELGRGAFFGETLPALSPPRPVDAVYVPSAPFGGDLPFRPDRGVANYYGVGGYRRPLADARTSGVRFAAECLAFANVPDEAVEPLPGIARRRHAGWKAASRATPARLGLRGRPRPLPARCCTASTPTSCAATDRERYLELSRAVSGEVMAEVFGEWRRAGVAVRRRPRALAARPRAGCRLGPARPPRGAEGRLSPPAPGAGAGRRLDHRRGPGRRRRPRRQRRSGAAVRARCGWRSTATSRRGRRRRDDRAAGPARDGRSTTSRRCVGRFVDASWAYRFGPPAQDVIVASARTGRWADRAAAVPGGPTAGRPAAIAVSRRARISACRRR